MPGPAHLCRRRPRMAGTLSSSWAWRRRIASEPPASPVVCRQAGRADHLGRNPCTPACSFEHNNCILSAFFIPSKMFIFSLALLLVLHNSNSSWPKSCVVPGGPVGPPSSPSDPAGLGALSCGSPWVTVRDALCGPLCWQGSESGVLILRFQRRGRCLACRGRACPQEGLEGHREPVSPLRTSLLRRQRVSLAQLQR